MTHSPKSPSGITDGSPRRRAKVLATALALAGALASAAPGADETFTSRVLSDPPDAIVQLAYRGSLSFRAQPVAVVDTGTDLGRLRVPMRPNDRGFWEAETFFNREGVYKVGFEGDDRIKGTRLRDDNDGKLYELEVTNPSTREARERHLTRTALAQIQFSQPQFRKADIFFNGRQPAGARVAVVRSEDGQKVWRVQVDNTGARKVRILERVR